MTYIPHLCPAMNNAGAGRRPIHCRGRGATFNFGRRISQTGEGALISTLPQTVSCLFRTTRRLPQSESAGGGTEKGDSGIETVGSSSPTQDNSRVTPGIAHIPLSGDARLGPLLSCGWYVQYIRRSPRHTAHEGGLLQNTDLLKVNRRLTGKSDRMGSGRTRKMTTQCGFSERHRMLILLRQREEWKLRTGPFLPL